ncbi:arylamine N-acetyltransferase [Thalassospira sp. HJ]|uniref:arylamine N-acetyltransferase family protein n=1 Tax=Thalassospira sp. HJ TaxID=1616823 RepID=UPI0009E265AF|nr:arylamine N-acetyltransferase [Thalassospira sp. HJ]
MNSPQPIADEVLLANDRHDLQGRINASWAKPIRTPEPEVDLDAYFDRIGYEGPRTASLDVLQALHALHPANIPFEAIDVLMGKPVSLAPADIDRKLIHSGRGGYCFEHNSLFRRVLRSLGFEVEGLAGRVLWGYGAHEMPRPRCHMVNRVTIDGEAWLADVGLGGCVPTAPLLLETSAPQVTSHDTYRVITLEHGYRVELERGGIWQPVHEIDFAPVADIDYEVMNWYAAHHPEGGFNTALIAARSAVFARFTLRNNRLTIRLVSGEEERHTLSVGDIAQTLEDIFGITPKPEWQKVFAKLA